MNTVETILDVVAQTASEVRGGFPDRRRTMDSENPSGDAQLLADVWADELLADRLTSIDGVGSYASEERESVLDGGAGLSVAVDPLDGSQNLKSNNTLGTLVGVYEEPLPASGQSLVAAAYVLYGSTTTMTVATAGSVAEYVVEDGQREVLREEVRLPESPEIYGFGGSVTEWSDEFRAFARALEREEDLRLRYGGSMVGDVNQVLTFGGVFGYPALGSRPDGKLRLQFEANPVAYIVETAGGRSLAGEQSVLEVAPTGLHQRTPVHVGNAELVDRLADRL